MAEIFSRIFAALIFVGLTGGITAALLAAFGDKTACYEKRVTLNPFAHVTVSGLFLAIAFRATWLRPLPLGRGRRTAGPVLAILGAMAITLALVPLMDLLRSPLHLILPRTIGHFTLASIDNLQIIAVNSVVLGLLPLPGMWLGGCVPALWPALEKRWRKGTGWGLSLAAILLILGWFPSTAPVLAVLKLV